MGSSASRHKRKKRRGSLPPLPNKEDRFTKDVYFNPTLASSRYVNISDLAYDVVYEGVGLQVKSEVYSLVTNNRETENEIYTRTGDENQDQEDARKEEDAEKTEKNLKETEKGSSSDEQKSSPGDDYAKPTSVMMPRLYDNAYTAISKRNGKKIPSSIEREHNEVGSCCRTPSEDEDGCSNTGANAQAMNPILEDRFNEAEQPEGGTEEQVEGDDEANSCSASAEAGSVDMDSEEEDMCGSPKHRISYNRAALFRNEVPRNKPSNLVGVKPRVQGPPRPNPNLTLSTQPSYPEGPNPTVQDGIPFFPVASGTQRTLDRMTVNFSASSQNQVPYIKVGWSKKPTDFPPLKSGQHALTDVLHCLPHGSTFASDVVITIDVPQFQNRADVWYSPVDVEHTPIWRKFRLVGDIFVEKSPTPLNRVKLLKNRNKAVLMLRHFCSFAIVVNEMTETVNRAEIAIFLKVFNKGLLSVTTNIQVLVGCDKRKLVKKTNYIQSEGFKMIEKVECLLYKTDQSDSAIIVGLRDVEWMVGGRIQKQQTEPMTHSLNCLWSGIVADSLFWIVSEGTGDQGEQLACSVFLRQEGRIEKSVRLFHELGLPTDVNRASRQQCHDPLPFRRMSMVDPNNSDNSLQTEISLHTEDSSSHKQHIKSGFVNKDEEDQEIDEHACSRVMADDFTECVDSNFTSSEDDVLMSLGFIDKNSKLTLLQNDSDEHFTAKTLDETLEISTDEKINRNSGAVERHILPTIGYLNLKEK